MSERTYNPNCPCTFSGCSNHGNCEACRKNHHPYGEKTFCEKLAEKEKRFSFSKNKN